MDIDVTAHRVDAAETIALRLTARKPEDAREDPVAFAICGAEFRRIDLAVRTARDKYRVERLAGTDLGANQMLPARRAEAAELFTNAIAGR